MAWLMDLIVGIDHVCKFIQCLCPWWIVDKNKNNTTWEKINEINIFKIEISIKLMITILMYVNIIFWWDPDLLKDIDLFSQKLWALWINNYENPHYWKK